MRNSLTFGLLHGVKVKTTVKKKEKKTLWPILTKRAKLLWNWQRAITPFLERLHLCEGNFGWLQPKRIKSEAHSQNYKYLTRACRKMTNMVQIRFNPPNFQTSAHPLQVHFNRERCDHFSHYGSTSNDLLFVVMNRENIRKLASRDLTFLFIHEQLISSFEIPAMYLWTP